MRGIIQIDKERDYTSFDVVAIIRKLTGTKKVGHTGTLDPFATGVLTVLLGDCTRLADLLPVKDKSYTARFRLGQTTDTGDITGKIITECALSVTDEQVRQAVVRFKGTITQIPPMYSAVQVNGVRLYKLARQGVEIERPSRRVTIHEISLISADENIHEYEISVDCGGGTYIRTLVEDIGKALGCGAVTIALRRTKANGIPVEDCLTIPELRELAEAGLLARTVTSPEVLLSAYESVSVSAAQAARFSNGGTLDFARLNIRPESDRLYRVYDGGKTLIGLGIADLQREQLRVKCLLRM